MCLLRDTQLGFLCCIDRFLYASLILVKFGDQYILIYSYLRCAYRDLKLA